MIKGLRVVPAIAAGSIVRVPRRRGDGSGLTRTGRVKFIDGRFARVELCYGQRVKISNTYTIKELEQERDDYAEHRRGRRK